MPALRNGKTVGAGITVPEVDDRGHQIHLGEPAFPLMEFRPKRLDFLRLENVANQTVESALLHGFHSVHGSPKSKFSNLRTGELLAGQDD